MVVFRVLILLSQKIANRLIDGKSLKNRNRIQVAWIAWTAAAARSRESQLAAGRAVGRVAEKIESQQRMIKENSV